MKSGVGASLKGGRHWRSFSSMEGRIFTFAITCCNCNLKCYLMSLRHVARGLTHVDEPRDTWIEFTHLCHLSSSGRVFSAVVGFGKDKTQK